MPFLALAAQCVAMFVASFAIGYLPLAFKSAMKGRTLKAVSVFGMGLLVGAALTVIIPEGVDTLYDSLPPNKEGLADTSTTIGVALLSGFALMLLVESLTPHPKGAHGEEDEDEEDEESQSGRRDSGDLPRFNGHSHTDDDATHVPTPDSRDETFHTGPYKGSPESLRMDSHTALFPKRQQRQRSYGRSSKPADRCQEAEGGASGGGIAGLNATLGLVIHAMADGIALGSSSLSSSSGLGLVVFLAVIVHKGPTALGLTTTLLSLRLSPSQIRKRLLLFSGSAPAGAIVTYLIVYFFGGGRHAAGGSGEVNRLSWWTGVTLLFSGGSFLYVATVVQPLSDLDSHGTHEHAHRHEDDEDNLTGWVRLVLLGVGMVLPLVTSMVIGGHGH